MLVLLPQQRILTDIATDKELQSASQHANGKPSLPIGMRKALEEKFDFEQ